MKQIPSIRDLPPDERPRERLASLGSQALSTQELLAIILGRGIAGEPVMTTAHKLLSHFGSLSGIQDASLEDLRQLKGLGFAKACQILACFALAKRLDMTEKSLADKRTEMISPEAVYNVLKPKLAHFTKEHFVVVSFDTRSRLLGVDTISIGTLNASLVHPRETFEAAIRRHAASIIIAHNHPSGDATPSDEDLKVTANLLHAGRLLGIEVVDHLIVTPITFSSLRESETVF